MQALTDVSIAARIGEVELCGTAEMRAEAVDTPHPALTIISSPEINEKTDAATITKILKSIVAEHQRETIAR